MGATGGGALAQRVTQQFASLFLAVEEHVFLAREVVEHRHASHIGGRRDVVHRHLVEAVHEEQARGGIRDGLPGGKAFAGAEVGRNRHVATIIQKCTEYR